MQTTWALQDSNLGTSGYEPAALTAELRARGRFYPERYGFGRVAVGPAIAIALAYAGRFAIRST